MKGTLYLVATPIGNLNDITFRAIEVLKKVDIIAAEDTRNTLKLLNHFNIKKTLTSYHRHNEKDKSLSLLRNLEHGEDIAIVTDAGTPGISDPCEEIVKIAIKNDIKIVPIPGACAFVNAIIASGLDTSHFSFYGFLPINTKLRKAKLEEIRKENKTIILYEAPHKIKHTIKELYEILGDRKVVIAKELTKIHETFFRGTLGSLIRSCDDPRGEFVILIDKGESNLETNEISILNNLTLEQHYEYYEKKGMCKKEIIKQIAKDRNKKKNEIYKYFLSY